MGLVPERVPRFAKALELEVGTFYHVIALQFFSTSFLTSSLIFVSWEAKDAATSSFRVLSWSFIPAFSPG